MTVKAGFRIKNILNENCVFVVLIGLILLVGMYGFVRSPRKISEAENRSLNQFEHFTLRSFIDNSFQSGFENAISDQFVLSEKIRTIYGRAISSLPTFGIDRIACTNKYLAIPNSVDSKRVTFNCEDYIVVMPKELNNRVYENIEKYNKMNKINSTYYYYIGSYKTYDFEQNRNLVDYAEILAENLKGDYRIASLDINSYDDHKRFFTKTDHHWSYVGAYQGFLDIAKILGIKNPSEPTGSFTSEEYAFGSHARALKNYDYLEKFTIYTFDIPEHETIINGVVGKKI